MGGQCSSCQGVVPVLCTAEWAEAAPKPHNCRSAPAQPSMWSCSSCPNRDTGHQALPLTLGTSYARPGENDIYLFLAVLG